MSALTFNPLSVSARTRSSTSTSTRIGSTRPSAPFRSASKRSSRTYSKRMSVVSELMPPSWAEDSPEMKKVFTLLTSTSTTPADIIPEKYLENEYAKAFIAEVGYTEYAEKLNGRLAMLGFVMYLGNMGDILNKIADAPLSVIIAAVLVNGSSLIPIVNPKGFIPEGVKDTVMTQYKEQGLEDLLTPELEQLHGRFAMLGMTGLILLAAIF